MADERDEHEQQAPAGDPVPVTPADDDTAVSHPVVDGTGAEPPATQTLFAGDEPAGGTGAVVASEPPAAESVDVGPPPVEATPAPSPALDEEGSSRGSSPAEAQRIATEAAEDDRFAERPELFVLGAFAGAFVLGKVLKRLTGGGD
jgi:hypothetical protein